MRSTNVILVIDSDPRACSFLSAHEFKLPKGYKIVTFANLNEAVARLDLALVGAIVIGINNHDDNPTIQAIADELKTSCPNVERIFYVANDVVDFAIESAPSDFHLVHKPFVDALLQKVITLMYEAPRRTNEPSDHLQS